MDEKMTCHICDDAAALGVKFYETFYQYASPELREQKKQEFLQLIADRNCADCALWMTLNMVGADDHEL